MMQSLILTLLSTSFLMTLATENPNSTRQLRFSSSNPHTVAIDSDLFTVSYYNKLIAREYKSYFNITSSSKPCILPLESNDIRGRIRAATLNSKIVVWGDGERKYTENNTFIHYKVFVIDPKTCTKRVLPDLVDKIPSSLYNIEPEVIVREDKFDIFYPSQTVCSPCTFDSNGNKIETTHQLQSQPINSQFYIRSVGKNRRYVAAYQWISGSSAVILFDQALNLERSKLLDSKSKLIGAAINSAENEPYVGIISALQYKSKIPIYTVFDSTLNKVFEVNPSILNDYEFVDAFANIDSLGNSYLTVIQKEKQGPNKQITLLRYNPSGRFVGQVPLGIRIHGGSILDRKEQALLVGEREYCLATHVRSGYLNPTETTNIKCIDVSKKF